MLIRKGTLAAGLAGGVLVIGLLAMLAFRPHAPQKLGYIDSTELVNTFDKAVQVRTALQTTTTQWQAEITTMEHDLDRLRQRYVNEHPRLSLAEQQRGRDQIAEREQAYVRAVQEVNQKAAALEAEKMQPVYQELNAILRDYGRQSGYYIIWGATPSGNIVYADSLSNLTDEVLAYIARRRNDHPEQNRKP